MTSVKHTAGFDIARPVDELFPLFSAEGETKWVPGWSYENVMGTTELSEDYVFVTRSHDHASTEAVWLVKAYKPESWLVQFYKVEPEDKVGIITVQLVDLDGKRTHVEVTYEYVAISDKGRAFIEGFDDEAYAAFIGEWEQLLTEYFGLSNGAK